MAQAARPRARLSAWQVVVLLVVVLPLGLGLAAGWQWYEWATAGDSPYDEIGIDVNGVMPAPLRQWACGRIAQRFPRSIPPYGC